MKNPLWFLDFMVKIPGGVFPQVTADTLPTTFQFHRTFWTNWILLKTAKGMWFLLSFYQKEVKKKIRCFFLTLHTNTHLEFRCPMSLIINLSPCQPTSQLRRAFAKVKFRTASDNWAVRTQKSLRGMGDGYVCSVFGGEMEPLLWEVFSLGSFTSPLFCCPLPFRFCSSPTGQHRTCWFHKLSQTQRSVRRKEKRGTLQPKDQRC